MLTDILFEIQSILLSAEGREGLPEDDLHAV